MYDFKHNKSIEVLIEKICNEKKRLYDEDHLGLHHEEVRASDYWGFIDDIALALTNVNLSYYELANIPYGRKNSKKMFERMFAYEFYHQIRIIANLYRKERYSGLHLNGEPNKSLSTYATIGGVIDKETIDSFKEQVKSKSEDVAEQKYGDTIIPDMILHAPGNLKRQVYMIEIKLQNNENAMDDLQKLTRFKQACESLRHSQTHQNFDNDPRFCFYIFIYVGADIMEKLKEVDTSKCDLDIVCFYKDRNDNYQCSTLAGLLNEYENK